MADPLEALRKAVSIGPPDESEWMRGEVAIGPPKAALVQLLKLLKPRLAPLEPLKVFAGERTRSLALPPSQFVTPKGFKLPSEFDPTATRGFREGGFGQAPENMYRYRLEQKAMERPSLTGKTYAHRQPGSAKLSEETVKAIRELGNQMDLPEIHKRYPDVAPNTIRAVITGDSWGWVK